MNNVALFHGFRRLRRATAGLAALVLLPTLAGAAGTPDRAQLADEATMLLRDVIRVDTTNPPGNETPAAEVLARKLRAEGITVEVFESSPGRGNLYARLPGRGGGRPIILLSHLDVVPADPAGWRFPPFDAVLDHGFVYGRGALDAKGVGVIQLATLLAVKRGPQPLDRDLILLATADEETGGKAGAGWVVEHRPDLVGDAEFLVTEGDQIHIRPGGRQVVQVAIAEKTPCWVQLTAHGPSGHGSTPPPETAVTKLVRALERLQGYKAPLRVVSAVETYFAALGMLEDGPMRQRLGALGRALEDPAFRQDFERNPRQNALIRNTLTPTVLAASLKTNVIPAEARAQLDCRLLPGEDPEAFLRLLRDTIADDSIDLQPLLSFPASSSDPASAFMAAVRTLARTELGDAPVVPSVIPGFTDSHYFRSHGVASYGFVPLVLSEDEEKTVHGVDERIAVDNLRDGIERLVTLLRDIP